MFINEFTRRLVEKFSIYDIFFLVTMLTFFIKTTKVTLNSYFDIKDLMMYSLLKTFKFIVISDYSLRVLNIFLHVR